MAKYATLKAERDEAVARAVEAERLSNVAVVQRLEADLAAALERAERTEQRCSRLRLGLDAVELRLEVVTDIIQAALDPNDEQAFSEFASGLDHG